MNDDGSPRSLWRSRPFLTFWTGQTISELGSQFGNTAMPVLAVSVLGASAAQLGVLNALDTAAFLVVGLPAGAWIDRMRKRRVMLVADAARALTLVTVPIAWLAGVLTIGQLFVVGAALSVGTVFFDVGYQSFVPVLVARDQVADANGKLETTAQISRIAGPAVAGALLAVIRAPLVLLAQVVGYAVSFVALGRVRDAEQVTHGEGASIAHDIREGMAFVLRHPLISRITASTSTSNLFGTVNATLLPLLILRTLHLPPAILGLIFSVGAIGGLVGAVLVPRLGRLLGEGRIIPIAIGVCSLGGLLQPLAAALPGLGVSDSAIPAAATVLLVIAELLISFGGTVYNIAQVSFRQRVCPPLLLGRMNASIRFLVWGVMPIGALAAGGLATWLGIIPTLWIGAVGGLIAVPFVALSPLATMRTLPDA